MNYFRRKRTLLAFQDPHLDQQNQVLLYGAKFDQSGRGEWNQQSETIRGEKCLKTESKVFKDLARASGWTSFNGKWLLREICVE
jgi:hypothetical protein